MILLHLLAEQISQHHLLPCTTCGLPRLLLIRLPSRLASLLNQVIVGLRPNRVKQVDVEQSRRLSNKFIWLSQTILEAFITPCTS